MINIPYSFSGTVNYERYDKIIERIKKFDDYYSIGFDESDEFEMFVIRMGNPQNPSILITASMHGTEWQGTQFSLDFMENIRDNTFPDNEFRDFLLSNFYLLYIPVMNPYGYDRTTPYEPKSRNRGRYTSTGAELNRDFAAFTQAESQNTRKVMDQYKPFAYLDLHLQTPDMSGNEGNNVIIGNGQSATNYLRDEWADSLEDYIGENVTRWEGYHNLIPLSRRYMRDQVNPYTPYTLSYIVEIMRPQEENGVIDAPLSDSQIYNYGIANLYLFFKTSISYFLDTFSEPTYPNRVMYLRDLENEVYHLEATTTHNFELNGNQSLTAEIIPTKTNTLFIEELSEMWEIVDDNDVEHKIIHVKREGVGTYRYKPGKTETVESFVSPYQTIEQTHNTPEQKKYNLKVEIKAIPLFFDDMDNSRIYERYDEHMTAQKAFSRIFDSMNFTFILVGTFEAVEWEGFGDGETRLETFKRALERYKMEFRIVGKVVYLEHQIGYDLNVQYRHKLNADNIIQEIDANEMWTYARGYGDYGDGDGGEDWQDAKLISDYESPLTNILGRRHAPPIKNGNITREKHMQEQLKSLVEESLKISITADIYDLQKQGYPIAQSQVGDRVFIIDERIGLDQEIRVTQQSITRNWKGDIIDTSITFGNEGLSKRHQAQINTATKEITELLEGKRVLPFSVLDEGVKNATKALKKAQSQLKFGSNGIVATDKNNPNLVTIFNSAGIGVSEDGGETFENAVTGNGVNASVVTTGTMLADRIAGGILSSLNENTFFDLNNGYLEMNNAEFKLGGGASIEFNSSNNRIYYELEDEGITRTSGLGVGKAYNDRFPVAWLGTTGTSKNNFDPIDDNYFTGIIINTSKRQSEDGIQNSIIGHKLDIRDLAVDYTKGFTFDLNGSTNEFYGMSTGSTDYHLGKTDNPFSNIYMKNRLMVDGDFNIRNRTSNDKGWAIETSESGNGDAITFRGLNEGEHNYQIGSDRVPSRITNIYLRYNPVVSSDERYKTDIQSIDLDLAKSFLDIEGKRFKHKLTNADLNEGVKGSNPYQFGFVAQDIEQFLINNNKTLKHESLVSTGKDNYKAMQYEQIHAIHHVLLQDLYKEVEELKNAAGI